jgi:hypothetical protein
MDADILMSLISASDFITLNLWTSGAIERTLLTVLSPWLLRRLVEIST